jgi:hypothetical protein
LHLEERSTPLPVAFNDASITNPSSIVPMPMAQKADDVPTTQHPISTPQTPPPHPKVAQNQSQPSSRPIIVHMEEDDDEGIPEINMESDSD